MGSTYLSLHYHLVFSTKERRPFIGELRILLEKHGIQYNPKYLE